MNEANLRLDPMFGVSAPIASRGNPNGALKASDRPTLCFPLAGDSLGGSHHSLLGLLHQLDREKYRILVIVEEAQGRLAKFFSEFEQVVDPAAPKKPFVAGEPLGMSKFIQTVSGLRARTMLLRDLNARIVHTNDGRSHATWGLPAKLANARLLWHHRADPQAKGLNYLAPFIADQIVSVSRFSLPEGNSKGALRNAAIVFSPFDTDISIDRHMQRQHLRNELALPEDAFIAGFFGNLIERKRPIKFVEAVASLRRHTSRPVHGVVFGEAGNADAERQIQTRIAELGLAHNIHMMGYRAPGANWIAACNVLVVPAVGEPLGRTLVEAMLVGTPVVATRSGGNPEAISDGLGILVPPDDPDALAVACAKLANGFPDIDTIIRNARASAQERFTRQRHLQAIEGIYADLLAK